MSRAGGVTAVTGMMEPGAGAGGPCATAAVLSTWPSSGRSRWWLSTDAQRVADVRGLHGVGLVEGGRYSDAVVPAGIAAEPLVCEHDRLVSCPCVPGPAVNCWPLSGVVSEIVGSAVFTWAADEPLGAAYATATKTAAATTAGTASRPSRRVGVMLHGTPFVWATCGGPFPRTGEFRQHDPPFYESLTGPGTAVGFATLGSR